MQIPLAFRAHLRSSSRRLVWVLTRHPAAWTPTDHRPARPVELARLAACRTAQSVQEALTLGHGVPPVPLVWETPAQQARALARHAGHLSPALLDWCLRHARSVGDVIDDLRDNPAVTPATLGTVRGLLEESAWRMAESGWRRSVKAAVDGRAMRNAVDLTDVALAWLAACHPAEPRLTCPPFMSRVLVQCVGDPRVLRAVATLAEIPDAVQQALRHRVHWDDVAALRAVCHLAPRVMTLAEIEAVIRMERPAVAPPWFALDFFDVLPSRLRDVMWRESFAIWPHQALLKMAALPVTSWPGLTVDDLTPLMTCTDGAVRLAAIQLLAGLEAAAHVPEPREIPRAGETPAGPDVPGTLWAEDTDRATGPSRPRTHADLDRHAHSPYRPVL